MNGKEKIHIEEHPSEEGDKEGSIERLRLVIQAIKEAYGEHSPRSNVEMCYELAVQEIKEEYKDKTPFEQKVMFEHVLDDDTKQAALGWWKTGPVSVEKIKKDLEHYFNEGMNCGGFALELFACIFPYSDSIEEATNNILQRFPFVRMLDEDGLKDGEYLVYYRNDGKGGHHFVKEENGKKMEKYSAGPIREFNGWNSFEDCPEVKFAVSRDHETMLKGEDGYIYTLSI